MALFAVCLCTGLATRPAAADAGIVATVNIPGVAALAVVQQPIGQSSYVAAAGGTVTQFGLAASHGVTGLLAHNYLAGAVFRTLAVGQDIRLSLTGGGERVYRVTRIEQYRALEPLNPRSDFVDLRTGAVLSVGELFARIYTGADRVVLQTCIARPENPTWGRLFVIAEPLP
jgi:hypothetical protein